jgi:signal-transduction protein with cAMP-binding, CBS, and nucleotidyltransferase domain
MLRKRVTEIMTEAPIDTIERGLTVLLASKVMKERARGSLVIVDAGRPVGIVTERDLVRRVIAEDRPASTKVADVMSEPLISVGPEATVSSAASIMYKNGIRRLPVIENDRLLGMVTSTDLARAMQREGQRDEVLLAMGRFKMIEELNK